MELNEIRNRIDAIDDEIVQLFTRRMECSKQVALAKQQMEQANCPVIGCIINAVTMDSDRLLMN